MKLDLYFLCYLTINSKWIKGFNIKAGILELLEENIKTYQDMYMQKLSEPYSDSTGIFSRNNKWTK